jgi:hypothetical protein
LLPYHRLDDVFLILTGFYGRPGTGDEQGLKGDNGSPGVSQMAAPGGRSAAKAIGKWLT